MFRPESLAMARARWEDSVVNSIRETDGWHVIASESFGGDIKLIVRRQPIRHPRVGEDPS